MLADESNVLTTQMFASHVRYTLRSAVCDSHMRRVEASERRPFVPRRQQTYCDFAPAIG